MHEATGRWHHHGMHRDQQRPRAGAGRGAWHSAVPLVMSVAVGGRKATVL